MDVMDLSSAVDIIKNTYKNIDEGADFNSTVTAFRYLRNLCGTNQEAQSEIIQDPSVLMSVKAILYSTLSSGNLNEEKLLCSQIGLQFLCNLVVSNSKNQEQVWLTCQDLFDVCLKFQDAKVQSFSVRILYNIFLGKPELLDELKHPYEDLIELTLKKDSAAIAELTLEIFILKSDYVFKYYDQIKPENRLLILEIIKNLITEENNKVHLQYDIVKFFSSQFTQKSDMILKTSETYVNLLDPVEVVKVLDLLIAFSSDDESMYFEILQKETSLLINCIMLLKNIHLISKEIGNNFSMITKISQISEVEKDESLQEHPAFGFKCSLIRLIGNLCWKNTTNQNKVRDLECIPVLLDCCNIDARNPFIIQWCIFAIRNICEKNIENQQVIASLSREGKIDSTRLQELGININTDSNGDSLFIAPWKQS